MRPSEVSDLQPLAIGNFWESVYFRSRGGTLVPSDSGRVEIVDAIPINLEGRQTVAWVYQWSKNQQPGTGWNHLYANGSRGLYRVGGVSDVDTLIDERLAYPYPATVGERAMMPISTAVGNVWAYKDSVEVTLIARDSLVVLPFGEVRAWLYEWVDLPPLDDIAYGDRVNDFYVPGIGLVTRRWLGLHDDYVKGEWRLYRYCVK